MYWERLQDMNACGAPVDLGLFFTLILGLQPQGSAWEGFRAHPFSLHLLTCNGERSGSNLSALSGTPTQRSGQIGTGVPSAPIISVDLKGNASVTTSTASGQILSQKALPIEMCIKK